jgi:flagellar motor switch protein FliG
MSKEKVTAWINASTLAIIRDQADQKNSTVSEVVNELLARVVTMPPEEVAPTMPTVQNLRQVVRREIRLHLEHLETICTRAAVDSDAARREQYQVLSKQFGAETATRMRRTATSEARTNLEKIRDSTDSSGTKP